MVKTRVEMVEGVPRWFTLTHHWIAKRRCLRRGHELSVWRSCNRCGEILR